jgi:hypothetical protein
MSNTTETAGTANVLRQTDHHYYHHHHHHYHHH